MCEPHTQFPEPCVLPGKYEQMVRYLYLLMKEEKRLYVLAAHPESQRRSQAAVELEANHAQAAEVLIALWQEQAGDEEAF